MIARATPEESYRWLITSTLGDLGAYPSIFAAPMFSGIGAILRAAFSDPSVVETKRMGMIEITPRSKKKMYCISIFIKLDGVKDQFVNKEGFIIKLLEEVSW